jgi:phosphonate transport system substrate-binding protein
MMHNRRKFMLKNILLTTVALLAIGGNVGTSYAQDIKELRIGILGGENEADRLRNYACLADHLKTEFGFEKVSLFPATDYDGVIQGLLGGTLDVAELGASGYAAVYLKDPKAVVPVLTTEQADSSTGYYSIGLARKDAASPIWLPPRARSSATPIRTRPRAT